MINNQFAHTSSATTCPPIGALFVSSDGWGGFVLTYHAPERDWHYFAPEGTKLDILLLMAQDVRTLIRRGADPRTVLLAMQAGLAPAEMLRRM